MAGFNNFINDFPTLHVSAREPDKINCPKHGLHSYTIVSTIEGHTGHWCQLCWLESLGKPLPLINKSWIEPAPFAQPTSEGGFDG